MFDERMPGHDEIAPLQLVLVVALVAQRARARVPAEVVQFVAGRRSSVQPTTPPYVDESGSQSTTASASFSARRVERRHVGELLGRGRDSGAGCPVKRRICRQA